MPVLRRSRSGLPEPMGLCCGNAECEKRPLDPELQAERVCDVCEQSGMTAYTCKLCDDWDVCNECATGQKQWKQVDGTAEESTIDSTLPVVSKDDEKSVSSTDTEEMGQDKQTDRRPSETETLQAQGDAADSTVDAEKPEEDQAAREERTGETETEKKDEESAGEKERPVQKTDRDGPPARVPPPRNINRSSKYGHMKEVLGMDGKTMIERCDTLPKVCFISIHPSSELKSIIFRP